MPSRKQRPFRSFVFRGRFSEPDNFADGLWSSFSPPLVPVIHKLLRQVIASRDGPPGAVKGGGDFSAAILFLENQNDAMVLFELFRPPPIPVGAARPFEQVWRSRTEMIESAPRNGVGSEAANLLDLVHRRAATICDSGRPRERRSCFGTMWPRRRRPTI